MKFPATIEGTPKRAIIRLPFNPNEVWRPKTTHYLNGTINCHIIRSQVENNSISMGAAWPRRGKPLRCICL